MNFQTSKKLIKKIKTLHTTLADEGGHVSEIEKDLLLSYIRELYEEVKYAEVVASKGYYKEVEPKREPQKRKEPVARPIPVKEAVAAEPEEELIVEAVKAEKEPKVAEEKNGSPSDQLLKLFEEKEVKELSDKLRMIPVKDLHKSMGINERIFTIKELFGNNQQKFVDTLTSLNELSSFAEAKKILMEGAANENDWGNPSKRNKAINFLRLVKRRYV